MKKLATALVVSLGAGLACAGGAPSPAGTTDAASGKPAAQGAGDTYLAKEFWDKNARNGYLGKEAVDKFRGADGKGIDMRKLDIDNDGKVSEREWTAYHETAGAAGLGSGTPPAGRATPR